MSPSAPHGSQSCPSPLIQKLPLAPDPSSVWGFLQRPPPPFHSLPQSFLCQAGPGGPEEAWLAAETLKPEPLRHHHPTVVLLPCILGWELRRDPWKHAREQSDRHEGTDNSQAISLWMFPRCFHPQSRERPWRDTSHRFSLF